MHKTLVFLLAFGFLFAGPLRAGADDLEAAARRGAALIAPFKRDLKQALQQGLADGPVAAVEVCQLRAPELATKYSQAGVEIGRSSHRLRNPANAPRAWMKPVIDAYLAQPGEASARAVELGDGRVGYAEPIRTQGLCLVCHGSSLAPQVAEVIRTRYPADQATGFAEGELRGIFWAEFPAALSTASNGECRAALRPLLMQSDPPAPGLARVRELCETGLATGDPDAAYQLALLDLGLQRWQPETAIPLIKEAAIAGVPEAQYWLAWQYEAGPLLENDSALALRWYQAAAVREHRLALQRLANAYAAGELGLPEDSRLAIEYRARAERCAQQSS
jgi:TPR repeat protein